MSTHRKISGSVVRLRCDACTQVFPHFLFEGEDDTETLGLGSLSTCAADELVIARIRPDEWNLLSQGGAARFEARLRQELGRDDLHFVHLIRTVMRDGSAAGVSFQDFLKQYRPPELVYSCPCCGRGESKVIEEVTVKQFLESGGRISLTGALTFT